MTISILQLSDLHRDPNNPIRNDVLLQSLENDKARYTKKDDPSVRPPDVIIVSGDVIQGVWPGTPDFEARLAEQYAEALEFLSRLADRFVAGDRQRVVIVPGNHDVSACHFMESLTKVDILPDRKKALLSQLFSPESDLRWSWDDLALFKISDAERYKQRLAAFQKFYSDFYKATRTYDLDATKQFDVFDYPTLDLTITAFSSCYNNDILNKQGAIHPACVAGAVELLRHPQYNNRHRLAVWHHNTEGLPSQSDYMDAGILQNLIDGGYSVGFHGHQHRPQFLDTRFKYGEERRITVISAGTLCGHASFAHARAYNIIELDTEKNTGRLHLREMQNDNLQNPIWSRRPLRMGNSAAFLDFEFDPPPEPVSSDNATEALVEAQRLFEAGEFALAVPLLDGLFRTDQLARRLLLECLLRMDASAEIIARFIPSVSASESIAVMDALWTTGQKEQLRQFLDHKNIAATTDPSVAELRNKYATRLK
ncbi:MAG: hypothetical protein CTY31_10615 [Hyphomicrobium sp.]|nr:MAG: hypothetical protein CTY31_10615 [Hyphomicrobium sp.]